MTAIRRLPRLVRRLLALALVALVVLAGHGLLVLPVTRHLAEIRAEIQSGREIAGRLAAAARRGSEAEAAERAAAEPLARLLLDGETEAIRLARLQTLVTDAASRVGIRITSQRAVPPAERDGLKLVGARFDFRADLATVERLVAALEDTAPMVIVDGLQLRAALGAVNEREPMGGSVSGQLLDASLSVLAVEARALAAPSAQPSGRG